MTVPERKEDPYVSVYYVETNTEELIDLLELQRVPNRIYPQGPNESTKDSKNILEVVRHRKEVSLRKEVKERIDSILGATFIDKEKKKNYRENVFQGDCSS